MHITIDVNIKGLESLLPLFNQLKLGSQEHAAAAQAPVANVVPMPTPAPVPMAQPVITTAAAPQLSVVPSPAPVAAPVAPPVQMIAPEAVPTAVQTYTVEQLAVAATQLMDAGRQPELVSLLATFGVQALTQLPKEQYGNFATQLRAMGAKI